MKPYAMVLPSTAFFGSSVGNFFVKSFNTGEAYLLLLLVFAFVMTYGLGYLIMCKISPRYKETMNPQLEQVQVQKSNDKTEEGNHVEEEGEREEEVSEDDGEDNGEKRDIEDGETSDETREDDELLEKEDAEISPNSSSTDQLRKRTASSKGNVHRVDTPHSDDEEKEMNISPLLEDETEPKKKK